MAIYGSSFTITYTAWNTSTNTGQTGDVGNHTLKWVKDGVASTPTNSATEIDATNLPGLYKLVLTAAEAQAVFGAIGGKSSTASVVIMPTPVAFEQFPTNFASQAITVGGAVTVGTNNDKTGYSLTQTFPANFSAMSITAGGLVDITQTAADKVWSTTVRALTDKSGFALTQAFPTNFSSLSITAGGLVDITQVAADKVWSTTTRLLTAGTNIVLAKGTGITGLNDITAAAAATGVWQDTTAGDFTVAGSIGKSLFTSGNVPGAASGLAIVGSNMGSVTSVTGGVTVTTNNDKTGYSLTQTFPTNFSAMSITAGGLVDITQTAADKVWSTTVRALTDKSNFGINSIAAGTIGTAQFAVGAIDSTVIAASANSAIAAAVMAAIVEGTLTLKQALQLIAAAAAGKVSGAATATITIRNKSDTVDAMVATVDADGNRSAITYTFT